MDNTCSLYNVLSGHIISYIKGLTKKLYAYALAPVFLQYFRFIGAMVSEIRFSKEDEEEEDGQSVKIVFTCI